MTDGFSTSLLLHTVLATYGRKSKSVIKPGIFRIAGKHDRNVKGTPFFQFFLKTFMKHFTFSTREVGKPSYLKVVFMSLSGLFSPVKKLKSRADPQIESIS